MKNTSTGLRNASCNLTWSCRDIAFQCLPARARENVKEIQCAPENQHNKNASNRMGYIDWNGINTCITEWLVTDWIVTECRLSRASLWLTRLCLIRFFWEQKADSHKFSRELFCSAPKPLVRRETRPPFEDRSVNQQSYAELWTPPSLKTQTSSRKKILTTKVNSHLQQASETVRK